MDEKYLIFTVREKQYALPSKIISEVAALERVFPLPLVPDYVRGLINRYSVPYALIDICFLLFSEKTETVNAPAGERAAEPYARPRAENLLRKVIVLKEEVDRLAFLIDDVTDIADLPPDQLMKIEQEETAVAGLISAFFEWKNNQVFCLETAEIINRIKKDFERDV